MPGRNWTRRSIEELVKRYLDEHGSGGGQDNPDNPYEGTSLQFITSNLLAFSKNNPTDKLPKQSNYAIAFTPVANDYIAVTNFDTSPKAGSPSDREWTKHWNAGHQVSSSIDFRDNYFTGTSEISMYRPWTNKTGSLISSMLSCLWIGIGYIDPVYYAVDKSTLLSYSILTYSLFDSVSRATSGVDSYRLRYNAINNINNLLNDIRALGYTPNNFLYVSYDFMNTIPTPERTPDRLHIPMFPKLDEAPLLSTIM